MARPTLSGSRLDLVLALAGLMITGAGVHWAIKQDGGWTAAPALVVLVMIAPLLLAFRTATPLLSGAGLAAATVFTLASVPVPAATIVFAAGTALALWTMLWRHNSRSVETWLDDLRALVTRPESVVPADLLLGVLAVSLIGLDVWRMVDWDEWQFAPDWLTVFVICSPITLALRRIRPVVPCVVLAVANLTAYWLATERWPLMLALGLALYSLARHRPWQFALPVSGGVLAFLVVVPRLGGFTRNTLLPFLYPGLDDDSTFNQVWVDGASATRHDVVFDRQWPLSLSLVLALGVCLGVLARLYSGIGEARERERELRQRAIEQEEEQTKLTERAYIARDLHDVIAHHVSLMVIQAETGPDLIRQGNDEVLRGFQRIGDTGRRALGELDRMLSALRDADGVPDPQLAPQPGLADLPGLVATVGTEGLRIDLVLPPIADDLPAGQQLTAYRIVQEALTNVVRHSGAERATVTIEIADGEINLMVADDGRGFDPAEAGRGRHGLAGMRERVRVHGGGLRIETAPGAGCTIAARIPAGAAVPA
ncbi:sensor histidine kinase [Kribbella sp. NBC_01245]|uniref:sensor histidine kinase n=1 Tax=Kribbella sp. NBC_01245 TaxID=2903578 RepID=UPI002E292D95|nr:sensor histidine kinase [Kribbella sp. NBC_01245]